ncbi:MAG: ATP synthase F1 subunit epsilon [Deltaproteobacteria bacterium]|jgi:F-type H+-transporting ATPase subunit epsilon|nr:ATP synthase F1 subunit epsilon [Deltaproteobacteria bacterium]
MSEKTFTLTVVSPDKKLCVDLPVIAVGAKGSEGDFTALPGHVPFLTDLNPGNMWYRSPDNTVREVFVSAGFVEVLPARVTVMADSCEYPDQIDVERAERAHKKALDRLQQLRVKIAETPESREQGELEIRKLEIKLNRSMARIKAAKGTRRFG